MSVVYRFHTAPAIKQIPPEVLRCFVGLEVPINTLEVVGTLGATKSVISRKYPKYPQHNVVMTKEALIEACFRQRRYDLGHFLDSHVNVDTFVVDGTLVNEV